MSRDDFLHKYLGYGESSRIRSEINFRLFCKIIDKHYCVTVLRKRLEKVNHVNAYSDKGF